MNFGVEEIQFAAPWGKAVKLITMPTVAVLILVSFMAPQFVKGPELARTAMLLVPMVILFGTLMFTVRGYAIKSDTLEIVRLGWVTRIPLSGLQSAKIDPEALKGSVRIFGNGGLFCFCGLFWNRSLGKYRAYLTDVHKAIVLRWNDRTVVVSPGATEEFLERLHRQGVPLL